jgi:hypothetical protein
MIHPSIALFLVGILPHLALAFFSPGLSSEGALGIALVIYSITTLACLVLAARRTKRIWVVVVFQIILMGMVLYESISEGRLYIGT